MFVKPAAGLRVFDPVRKQFMPDEGMEVDPNDHYWARRLRDKDVVQATPPADAATASTTKPAADQAQAASTDKGAK